MNKYYKLEDFNVYRLVGRTLSTKNALSLENQSKNYDKNYKNIEYLRQNINQKDDIKKSINKTDLNINNSLLKNENLKTNLENNKNEDFQDEIKFEIFYSGNFESQQDFVILKNRLKSYKLKQKLENFSESDILVAKKFIKECKNRLKREWPVLFGKKPDKFFVHFDLDCFYASVESLYNEEFKNIPMAVGSNMMISTANYPARKYGIRAGMPGYHAKKLYPAIKIVKPDMRKYERYSKLVMDILKNYDKNFEIYSIDEACLSFDKIKYKKAVEYHNSIFKESELNQEFNIENLSFLITKIRNRVENELKITLSAGISVCRGLAKMVCSINKPNGQFVLKDNFLEFLKDKSIDKLNGIGKKTKETLLKTLNIKTIGELHENHHLLYLIFKTKTFNYLFRLSFGLKSCDSSFLKNEIKEGIGNTKTIEPTNNKKIITELIWNLVSKLHQRMTELKILGFTYILNIKYETFSKNNRQLKIKNLKRTKEEIFEVFMSIFNEISDLTRKIRFIGIRIKDIISTTNIDLLNKYLEKPQSEFDVECKNCKSIFKKYDEYLIHKRKCVVKKGSILNYFKK